ncbi:hypothetical protein K469DRAFT_551609 [Zopfia rhizophila CBS 207.26]|uniref:Glyoxalase family protein n=1 Tax=Zopfia rhizophila CBS 207.26 TaxID=1314779 RepID=A0A6A6ENM3_9PEZI|nr:hypothetical protein K469DRAFT_551609 [Zopfia rhizophila CBS 207.26]
MIVSLAHVNLTVPVGTLDKAEEFYGRTLGLKSPPVPHLQRDSLGWFDIGTSGQQIHIAFGENDPDSSRHPCFRIESGKALLALRKRVWDHYQRADAAAPLAADEPGKEDSGDKGIEYPVRFFARDYAGNRLEFSL